MRLRMTGVAAVVSMTLSALIQAQQGGPVDIRDNDGRLIVAPRVLNPGDVPPASILYGITTADAPDGKSVIVRATPTGSLLQVGDRVDEIQLPGIKDRQRNVNPGYWPYQVWNASDFYRLAAKCTETCLVRLRSVEDLADSRYSNAPRVFAYLPVGTGAGFGVELDEDSGAVAKYVDLRTGERFGPPASAVFGR
jgi:hypothetical protein